MSELKTWVVNVGSGEAEQVIHAETWECGDNGLCFKLNGEKVAWFLTWRFFVKEASTTDVQP